MLILILSTLHNITSPKQAELLTSSCFNHIFYYTLTLRVEKAARRVKIEFVENKIEITDIAKAQKITFPLQKIVSELYSNNENQEFKNKLLVQK